MTGAFRCMPLVCGPCALRALDIQRKVDVREWRETIDRVEDERVRECIREYLDGVWLRGAERTERRPA